MKIITWSLWTRHFSHGLEQFTWGETAVQQEAITHTIRVKCLAQGPITESGWRSQEISTFGLIFPPLDELLCLLGNEGAFMLLAITSTLASETGGTFRSHLPLTCCVRFSLSHFCVRLDLHMFQCFGWWQRSSTETRGVFPRLYFKGICCINTRWTWWTLKQSWSISFDWWVLQRDLGATAGTDGGNVFVSNQKYFVGTCRKFGFVCQLKIIQC